MLMCSCLRAFLSLSLCPSLLPPFPLSAVHMYRYHSVCMEMPLRTASPRLSLRLEVRIFVPPEIVKEHDSMTLKRSGDITNSVARSRAAAECPSSFQAFFAFRFFPSAFSRIRHSPLKMHRADDLLLVIRRSDRYIICWLLR